MRSVSPLAVRAASPPSSRRVSSPRLGSRGRASFAPLARAGASGDADAAPPGPAASAATSDRVSRLQNEGAYAVLAAATALERRGVDVVHLEIGQPGFPSPPHVVRAGVDAIETGKTKYSSPAGVASLKSAIAAYVSRTRGVPVDPAEVVVGPGAKPGLFFPTLALVNPGDEVIIPDPGFPTYRAMVEVAGGVAVPMPLRPDGASFDMDRLRRAFEEGNPKMIVLNSPANPTGGVMPREDVEEVARLAARSDAWVMSDEIYARLVYDDDDDDDDDDADDDASGVDRVRCASVFGIPGMRDRTVLVDGFSKTYCMTGWRLGWCVAPEALARKIELLVVHSVGCTATFTQEAGVAALEGPQDGVGKMLEAYRERRDFVVDALNAIEGVECPVPAGAFYAFPDVSSFGMSSKALADLLLEEGGVAVLPGTDFGENGEGKIRISYVGDMATLEEGMKRIADTLETLR